MTQTLHHFIQSNQDELVERWMSDSLKRTNTDQVGTLSSESQQRYYEEFLKVIMSVVQGEREEYEQLIQRFSEKMDKLSWPLTSLVQGTDDFKGIVSDLFLTKEGRDDYPELSRALDEKMIPFITEIIKQYRTHTKEWEQTINVQRLALRELSAPLIPIFENISVMPLIGTIDTERAKWIMENLLQGVIRHESNVVLIDITGVPVVDTMVAHHIIQAAEAVRLVGARCIIVGIRPEIAQTIVTLGIDLTDTPTLSTLRKGIDEALQLTGRQIVDIE